MVAVVYKATNKVNGKSYIGFDSNWPKRKSGHKRAATQGKGSLFHRAIRKYGWDSFSWEILVENASLDDEKRLIKEYNTRAIIGFGYNLTDGGEGNLGWIMKEETKSRISSKLKGNKSSLGRVLSEETKKKISDSLTGKPGVTKGRPSPLRGTKQSEETIRKRVESRKKNSEVWHSEETKRKIGKKHKGRKLTEQQLEAHRERSQRMKGRKHSEESIKKMRAAHLGKVFSDEHRKNIGLATKRRHEDSKQRVLQGF